MAVQQNKKTRSRRGMRRSHDALNGSTLSVDQTSGETHRRHHVSADGFYRGEVAAPTVDDPCKASASELIRSASDWTSSAGFKLGDAALCLSNE